MTTPNKPRRRWLHFSLRSVFLLMLVIGVSLAWTIYKVRQQTKKGGILLFRKSRMSRMAQS